MIRYRPEKILKKVAPTRTIKRVMTDRMAINRTVLGMLSEMEFISKRKLATLALRVVKQYRARYEKARDGGATRAEALEEAIGDKALLVQRIENAVVYEIAQDIKDKYEGEFYTWLPSDAEEPDPEHQLNYGKKFQIGDGEMPGERPGCRCAMDIHVKDTELQLEAMPEAA